MAMPQRDDLIDEIVKTDALLEYAVTLGSACGLVVVECLTPRESCLV